MSFHPPEPIIKPAQDPPKDPAYSAAIIFLHGLGDDATPYANVADQFQRASKLPYCQWILPNAPENRDSMMTAWYTPTSLSSYNSSRPELDDPEDEDGLLQARRYIEGLIDGLVASGVPTNRIILGGFSQGHAVALLTGLTSTKYAGKLAGIVGLSGYLPLQDRIDELRSESDVPATAADVPIFIVRGKSDMLVPKRYLRLQLDKLKELGVPDDAIEVHEYDGLGHRLSPLELSDLCTWLEKVIPPLGEPSAS